MKHTPGPWSYLNSEEYPNEFEIIKGEYFIAKTYDGVEGLKNSEANARLIAAAPEMLEVLIDEYKNMCNYCNEGCVGKEKIWKCGVKIKDIIEKATGLNIEEVLK